MKKLVILTCFLSVALFASNVKLEMAQANPKKVAPSSANEVLSFQNSIKSPMKSVVNISTRKVVQTTNKAMKQMFNDPLFRKFFGSQFYGNFKQNRVLRALGSGVIISKDGYIVTNNHVVSHANKITVTISGTKTQYNAKVIGRDRASDLAVIKINAKNLVPIKFAYAKNLAVGDLVFAIGDPFGVGETVTQGIISALNKNSVGINQFENFIQTDASINPGNSGGALVDSRGALIGINSAIVTKSGGNNGIGFAIPVSMVKDVAMKLIKSGKVTRGYLGVVISDLNKGLQAAYKHKSGALILDVAKHTPAKKYGLKRGDLIYAVNDKKIMNRIELQKTIASYSPNAKVVLSVERDKSNIKIKIILGNRAKLSEIDNHHVVLGGLSLHSINENIARRYRLASGLKGVLITNVKPKSRAEKVGFQAGDVIIQINDKEISSLRDIRSILDKDSNHYRKEGHHRKDRHHKKDRGALKKVYVNRYSHILVFAIR